MIGHGGVADQVECNIANTVLLAKILFEKLKSMGHVDSRYKPHVAGHSFGGSGGAYFTLPDTVESLPVESLTLVDPAFTNFDSSLRIYAQDGPIGCVAREIIEPLVRKREARKYFPGWSDDMIRPQLRIVGKASKKSRQECIRSLIESEEETKRIFKERRLKTQINLITGEKAIHRNEKYWLRGCGVKVYELMGEDAGHCPHIQRPDEFNELLYDLLTGDEESARLGLIQRAR